MASTPAKTTTAAKTTTTAKKASTPAKATTTTKASTTSSSASKSTSTTTAKKATTPAKAPGAVLEDTRWITGPNDGAWTMCGPVAVANHLLAVTGMEASNADIERLYRAAGAIGDSGAPLEFFLAAAMTTELAGCRLASYEPTERIMLADSMLLGADAGVLLLTVAGVPDLHAAALTPDGRVVLWGDEVPLVEADVIAEDAWSLTWHGKAS